MFKVSCPKSIRWRMFCVMAKKRLLQLDWIKAGFRALKTRGSQAVRVEPLARSLGVSKGSFYHHFKDLPDFHRQMIDHWMTQATDQIIDSVDALNAPVSDRFSALIEIATSELDLPYGGPMTEIAIRNWAQFDPMVGAAQTRVDAARLAVLQDWMAELKAPAPELSARLFYHAYIGGAHEDIATRRRVLQALIAHLSPGREP